MNHNCSECSDKTRVGDKGQRYEVRAMVEINGQDEEHVVGYTDDETGGGLVRMLKLHPSWHSPRVIDRGLKEENRSSL